MIYDIVGIEFPDVEKTVKTIKVLILMTTPAYLLNIDNLFSVLIINNGAQVIFLQCSIFQFSVILNCYSYASLNFKEWSSLLLFGPDYSAVDSIFSH